MLWLCLSAILGAGYGGYLLGQQREQAKHHDLVARATSLAIAVLRQSEAPREPEGFYWQDDNGCRVRPEPRQ